jgi:hypothetical protein
MGSAAMATLVIAGLVHAAGRGFHPVPVRHLAVVQALSVLLVLARSRPVHGASGS